MVIVMSRRRTGSAGFTLVEVLVSLMVMALMASMAWQGVDAIVRARDASQQRVDSTLRINTVLAQWEHDLGSLQETASVPPLSFDGATLRLTRRAIGGIQLVTWALRSDAGGGNLQRWASPAYTTRAELQDAWLSSQQFQGSEPGQLRALSGLSQWQVYFYRGNAWSNAQSSGDLVAPRAAASAAGSAASAPEGAASAPGIAAGAPARQALPSGVRLVLEFADGGDGHGSLIRDTLLGP
ncbi:MAG: prepilin-type N-terminal cleavage/methylation domain-containing protein [Burkholderiaceae bacterium]